MASNNVDIDNVDIVYLDQQAGPWTHVIYNSTNSVEWGRTIRKMATKTVCDHCEKNAPYVVELTESFFPKDRRESFRQFIDMDEWGIDWCGDIECLKLLEAETVLKLDAHWNEIMGGEE